MTNESINKNVKRLFYFYGVQERTFEIENVTPKDVIDTYARCLDFLGAPETGLSMLIFEPLDYLEFSQWVANLPFTSVVSIPNKNEKGVLKEGYLHFQYNGYFWHVKTDSLLIKNPAQ